MDDFRSDATERGDRGQRVLYVLGASLVLAALAMIAIAFTS
jgi:hypothetical protein